MCFLVACAIFDMLTALQQQQQQQHNVRNEKERKSLQTEQLCDDDYFIIIFLSFLSLGLLSFSVRAVDRIAANQQIYMKLIFYCIGNGFMLLLVDHRRFVPSLSDFSSLLIILFSLVLMRACRMVKIK